MKQPQILYVIFALFCYTTTGYSENTNQIQINTNFDTSTLSLINTEREGVDYTEIMWDGLNNSGKPGMPSLPERYIKISVPADAINFSVTATVNKSRKMGITNLPLPSQYPAVASSKYPAPSFIHLNEGCSNDSKAEIKTTAQVDEIFTIGGFNKVVSIVLHPVTWNSQDNSLGIITDATISLSWETDANELTRMSVPNIAHVKEKYIQATKDVVVNPGDVDSNARIANNSSSIVKAAATQNYIPYIIITTRGLESAFERLAAFRRLRGFQTKIYTIEEILSDSRFAIGDVVSGLADDAGKLRAFLKYAHNSFGTEYVLLAGEDPKIPGRWATYYHYDEKGNKIAENYVCDQYYRDLTTKWTIPEVNFTETEKLSGISQDLNIGRISIKNSQEFDNYIDKLIQYEFNIKDVDLSYLENAFVMCGSDQSMYSSFESYSLNFYENHFSNLNQLLIPAPSERIVTGQEAMSEMKTDFWGVIDWRCHGGYEGVLTSLNPVPYSAYGINALDNYNTIFVDEDLNGLDSWRNKNHPCWTFSMSCNLCEIRNNHTSYNFAESFILGKNYGGICFIGNSGPGLIWTSSRLIQDMLNEVNVLYSKKVENASAATIFSKGINNSRVSNKHVKATIGIVGDPLVPLWFKTPSNSSFNGSFHPPLLADSDTVSYAKYFFGEDLTKSGQDNVINCKGIVETLNHTQLVSRMDMLPFIYPTRITSLISSKDGYWFMGRTRFFSSNDGVSLRLLTNRKVTIEALGTVDINGNIVVEDGSQLNIIAHKPLLMNDCRIESEGSMTINAAQNVEIGKGTTIAKGVRFEIKNRNEDED